MVAKPRLQVTTLEAAYLIGETTTLSDGMIRVRNSFAETALADAAQIFREADDG
jgi:hypothetical protein